jgi:uncharacterized membrane-anchored protein YhcB (DUF1043 family)
MGAMHWGAGIIGFILGVIVGPWIMSLLGMKK